MNQPTADVAVIGAGIIGTSVAERLQFEGKKVVLIDKTGPGEGCSKGNAGHFATDIILPLANLATLLSVPKLLLDPLGPLTLRWGYLPKLLPWLLRFTWAAMPHKTRHSIDALKVLNRPSIARFKDLLERTGLQDLMTQHGALTIYQSQSAAIKNTKHARLVREHGVKVEQLSGDQVRELEPALTDSITGGLFYPDTAHSINPFRLVTALSDIFLKAGGKIIVNQVKGFDFSDPQKIIIQTHGEPVFAKEVVIACGAWSKQLVEPIGHKIPLETERGYHLMLPSPKVDLSRPVTSFERSFVMTPMEEGLRLAGTVELAGLSANENWQRAATLYQHANKILPGLCDENNTHWMGHRPSLPDSLPIIGRSPIRKNMLFAFGHQHLGLTQAAVTADMICAEVLGEKQPFDLAPFKVDRF